ncbi:MAG TPA: ABC transporter ATP-binding protein [Microcella sp.]|nr:ABC transporter ATP-binding protein [Microcella sp.]
MTTPALEVENLTVEFATGEGRVRAVSDVSFTVPHGGALGVVGESGSGKSVTALAIMGLLPRTAEVHVSGSVRIAGTEVMSLAPAKRRAATGRLAGMVYQDSLAALNPSMTIGRQLTGVIRLDGVGSAAATERAVELLDRVGIADPRSRLGDYPHQFSGGMRQRVLIAMALARRPKLLIADEPTTALDVTVQAQIVELVDELRASGELSVLWITHDLALVSTIVEQIAVMYAGRLVEQGPLATLFDRPAHPYTKGLLGSIPSLDGRVPLTPIPGTLPRLGAVDGQCSFAPRCPRATERCTTALPPLEPHGVDRVVACHHPLIPEVTR